MAKAKTASSEKLVLSVVSRTVFGKKLKKLRHAGLIPANVFGPEFKSVSVSTQFKDFAKTYKTAKETGIVYLTLDKEEVPVLIKQVQRHPVTDNILHVDFRKVDLKKKIQTEVPVKTIGVSEAVTQKAGVLLTLSETLLVEALPQDIPQAIEIDISSIKELGQEIKVSQLPKSSVYEIKNPVEKVVVSVVEHKEESITPETAAAAPEVIGEVPTEGAPVEGAAPSEGAEAGAKPAEGGKKPEKTPAPTKPLDSARGKPAEKKEEKK